MELHRASIRSSAVHPSVVASTREEEEEEEEGALTFGWFRRSVGFLEFTSGMHCGTLTTSPEARISSVSVSLASFIISCSCTQPQDHMEPGQHHGTVLCAACGVQHAMGWPHTQREERRKEKEGGGEGGEEKKLHYLLTLTVAYSGRSVTQCARTHPAGVAAYTSPSKTCVGMSKEPTEEEEHKRRSVESIFEREKRVTQKLLPSVRCQFTKFVSVEKVA